MPRVAASTGVRPEYRALAVIAVGVPVTPEAINACVGTGDYAAKYISFLRRDGFVFDATKEGRRITAYTLTKEPPNAETFRNMTPKAPAAKPVKAKKVKVKAKAKKVKAAPKDQEAAAAVAAVGLTSEEIAAKLTARRAAKATETVAEKAPRKAAAKVKPKRAKKDVPVMDRGRDPVEAQFGTTGEVARGSAYSVDPDWDSAEGLDVSKIAF